MLDLRKTLKCSGGRVDFQRFALHLESRVMHMNMHSGTKCNCWLLYVITHLDPLRRMTWHDHGDGTFVKSRALSFLRPTPREVHECHLLFFLLTPQQNCQRDLYLPVWHVPILGCIGPCWHIYYRVLILFLSSFPNCDFHFILQVVLT